MFDETQINPLPGSSRQPTPFQVAVGALHKHRRLAVTVFLLVVVVLMLQSYSTVPRYRATARLAIQDERSTAVAGLDANDVAYTYWRDPELYYETQYRILTSRSLAERVARRLQLADVPEFNGTGPQQPSLRAAIQGAYLGIAAHLRTLLRRPHPQPPPAPVETAKERGQIDFILGRVEVTPIRSTRLVDVTFTATDPEFATRAVNALAEEYVQRNLDLRLRDTRQTLTWIAGEIDKQRAKLEASELALASYREEQDALSLEDRQNIVVARLNQLNEAVTVARLQRLQKEAMYHQVSNLDPRGSGVEAFAVIAQNRAVEELRSRIAGLRLEQARLAGRYGAKHPQMIKLTANIESAAAQLERELVKAVDAVRAEYESAVEEERRLTAELNQQKQAAIDLDGKSVGYTVLEREAESHRRVHEALLQQEKELQVIGNSEANNVQIVDLTEIPGAPFTPNIQRDWYVAVLAGLLLAFGLVGAIEYFDDTVKTPSDVTQRLGLPVLGLIPSIGAAYTPLVSTSVPPNFLEAFRSLRTALAFTSPASQTRIVSVTSTQPLEGKTTTACNLAMALAMGGARVLLIDADLRRPKLHQIFDIDNALGLSHLLVGRGRVRHAIRECRPGLHVLPAGQAPPNPPELLSSRPMTKFLGGLGSGPFDWVILDTPPVLAVTDAVALTPAVSGVVFVVGAEATRSSHAQSALETLRTGNQGHIFGVVLNRIDFDRNKYYYSRYYGRDYDSYYGAPAPA